MTAGVSDRAQDGDWYWNAVASGGRGVEGPGGAKLNGLVGAMAAIQHRRSRINDGYCLAAGGAVAASIHGLPDSGRIEGAAAMTGGIRNRAQDGDGDRNAVVGSGRRVERPGCAKLNGLVGAAGAIHRGSSRINDRDRLAASG